MKIKNPFEFLFYFILLAKNSYKATSNRDNNKFYPVKNLDEDLCPNKS